MATDYDAPRKRDVEDETDSLEGLKANTPASASIDVDETEAAENLELPGAVLSDDTKLEVLVIPTLEDEFVCTNCRTVRHRTLLFQDKRGICLDCVQPTCDIPPRKFIPVGSEICPEFCRTHG